MVLIFGRGKDYGTVGLPRPRSRGRVGKKKERKTDLSITRQTGRPRGTMELVPNLRGEVERNPRNYTLFYGEIREGEGLLRQKKKFELKRSTSLRKKKKRTRQRTKLGENFLREFPPHNKCFRP